MIATKASTAQRLEWEAQKAKLKATFPKLTEEDLNFDATKKNEMLSNLEVKLGMTIKELQVIIGIL
jgi:hypothetical protein